MDRVILTEGTLVDSTVGEDKEIFGHIAGALKCLRLVEEDFGINHCDPLPGDFIGNPGNHL